MSKSDTQDLGPARKSLNTEVSLTRFVGYFLWLGTVGFGGPIALAGHMQQDLVNKYGWFTQEDYVEGLALAQLAPGPLAAQLAIYLGFLRAGFVGATLVAVAFVLPSFVMVLGLSAAYVRFGGLSWMQGMFYGIGAAVIGIIARSAYKLSKLTLGKDYLLGAIFLVLAISTAYTSKEAIGLFLLSGLVYMLAKGQPWTAWKGRSGFGLAFAGAALSFTSPVAQLFFFFAKAGMFVFGSGLAVLPFLYGGVVGGHHWLTEQQFVDAIAVAMITPGPVVITVAFVGYLVAGFGGAVAAAAGVFLPVYAVVILFAPSYKRWSKVPQLNAFVRGITAAATGAIAGAVIVLARRSIVDLPTLLIAAISLLVLMKWKIPEPVIIAIAAVAGLLLHHR
ncbi:MAG: chromate efflux transporter [Acidobacteriales bacterium]|nr:chromate efflux transporter [Terriglobales bacterium]